MGLSGLLEGQDGTHGDRDLAAGDVPDEQDRALWDLGAVHEAKAVLATTGTTPPEPYQLQAAIALLHGAAPVPGDVNWPAITALYPLAIGRARRARRGARGAGPLLDEHRLAGDGPLHAAHADLLERAGDPAARAT